MIWSKSNGNYETFIQEVKGKIHLIKQVQLPKEDTTVKKAPGEEMAKRRRAGEGKGELIKLRK